MSAVLTSFGDPASTAFPGKVLQAGSTDAASVKRVEQRLNALGCGPVPENGVFDADQTKRAVNLFQSRFMDVTGQPLEIDGKVGSLTWGAMFGASTVPSNAVASNALAAEAVAFAITQIGVMEQPLGSNRGPEVDEYVRAAGLSPSGGFAWCVAFTHFCYLSAAKKLGVPNPHIRTAGVLDHWNKAGKSALATRITTARAVADPGLVQPGQLFIIDLGSGLGHSGMVVEVSDGRLVTIEGNTNDNGSRNGIGVFRRAARKIGQINKGFIGYGTSE